MSYTLRASQGIEILFNGRWILIPNSHIVEKTASGCRVSQLLGDSITDRNSALNLLQNTMGLDDREHAEFIEEIVRSKAPERNDQTMKAELQVGDRVVTTRDYNGYFVTGQRATVTQVSRGYIHVEFDEEDLPTHLGREGGPWERRGGFTNAMFDFIGRPEQPRPEPEQPEQPEQTEQSAEQAEQTPEEEVTTESAPEITNRTQLRSMPKDDLLQMMHDRWGIGHSGLNKRQLIDLAWNRIQQGGEGWRPRTDEDQLKVGDRVRISADADAPWYKAGDEGAVTEVRTDTNAHCKVQFDEPHTMEGGHFWVYNSDLLVSA